MESGGCSLYLHPHFRRGLYDLELAGCLRGYLFKHLSILVDHVSSKARLDDGFDEAFDVHSSVEQFPRIDHAHSLLAHWKERESPGPIA